MDKVMAVDCDGVLHAYSRGWQDGSMYDVPVAGAVEGCHRLIEDGWHLIVFTVREDLEAVEKWLEHWEFPSMAVTNGKPGAAVYLDDRAVRFASWDDTVSRADSGDWVGSGSGGVEGIQGEIHEWQARQPFGASTEWWHLMLGVVEEAGELSHAALKQLQGIRGSSEEHEAAMQDAVGDLLVYLAELCTQRGWNMLELWAETWSRVKQRDWNANPGNGVSD